MTVSKIPVATPLRHLPTAIVVGASSGIGAALTRKLAREGYLVAAVARRKELLDGLCAEINTACGEARALPFVHDVTDYQSVPLLLQQILQNLGSLDLIIYNSGIQIPVKVDEFDFDKDRAMFETNLLGALAWLKSGRGYVPAFTGRTDCRHLLCRRGSGQGRRPGLQHFQGGFQRLPGSPAKPVDPQWCDRDNHQTRFCRY